VLCLRFPPRRRPRPQRFAQPPDGAVVTFAPIEHPGGPFVVLEIALDGTVAVTAVLAVAAIKVVRS
jgi:hypothetical protein